MEQNFHLTTVACVTAALQISLLSVAVMASGCVCTEKLVTIPREIERLKNF